MRISTLITQIKLVNIGMPFALKSIMAANIFLTCKKIMGIGIFRFTFPIITLKTLGKKQPKS
jgi:hypothetical protein